MWLKITNLPLTGLLRSKPSITRKRNLHTESTTKFNADGFRKNDQRSLLVVLSKSPKRRLSVMVPHSISLFVE